MKINLVAVAALLTLGTACSGGGGGNGDGNPEIEGGNGDVTTSLDEGLTTQEACDGYTDSVTGEFTAVAGATRYFYGWLDLTAEGDASGTETMILLPNDEWKSANATDAIDCEVVWDIVGKVDTEETCASCDYTLNVTSTLNAGASTCVQDVVNGYMGLDGDISYDVTLTCSGDGACAAAVTNGGSFQAAGEGNSSTLAYIDDGTCQFF